MPTALKIVCTICKRKTKLTALKFLDDDESKEYLNKISSDTSDMINPEFSKADYHAFKNIIKNDHTSITISKIHPHKIGLFKENCIMSNKIFKVAFYYFINHEKQLAGVTFRIGEEVIDFKIE